MFNQYFDVYLADTEESKKIHYNIRYQVYCEEMGFEDKSKFVDEQEIDQYDSHSEHFIVKHRETNEWVGAMRLVLSEDGQSLPFSSVCELHESVNKRSAELSRLCVLGKIRRSKRDESVDQKEYKKISQSVIWGLLNAASAYCYKNKIPNWYFMTCNALRRVLEKKGFMMELMGEGFEHKGKTKFPFKKDAFNAFKNEVWREDFHQAVSYYRYSESAECEQQEVAA